MFILFASIILLRHDGTALWGIIGSVSNATLCVVLKRMLNQARPATTSRTDPGMPSSHAQSISYISLFAVLSGKQLKTKNWKIVKSIVFTSMHGTVNTNGSYCYSTVMEWFGTSKVSLFLSCLIIATGSYFVSVSIHMMCNPLCKCFVTII